MHKNIISNAITAQEFKRVVGIFFQSFFKSPFSTLKKAPLADLSARRSRRVQVHNYPGKCVTAAVQERRAELNLQPAVE